MGLYVHYILDDGTKASHGGPYPPMKAREVRDAMKRHIENGRYSGWNIPENAVDVETSEKGLLDSRLASNSEGSQ